MIERTYVFTFVLPDGESDALGSHSVELQQLGDDPGLLQHLGGEVLQDGREVDRGELAHPEREYIKDENNIAIFQYLERPGISFRQRRWILPTGKRRPALADLDLLCLTL